LNFPAAPAAEVKVSVIMNCLNGAKYVQAAIDSVYAQTYGNWEIIFLDNASTDDTPLIARRFDEKLRYFRNQDIVPLGAARNQALRQATGEFIAFLDSDDVWLPRKLEQQIPLFRDRPGLGLVFSDTELRFQASGLRTTYFKNHRYKPPRGRIFPELLQHYSIPMPTAVIRAGALRAMDQWFDDSYQVCDDFDFFMRLAYDWECDYLDQTLASCLIHGEAVTFRMHRFGPGEMAQTIQKFRGRHADFDLRFGKEVRAFLKQVSYKQGKSFWIEGKRREARVEFGKYFFSPKFLLSSFATLLPYTTVERIARFLRR